MEKPYEKRIIFDNFLPFAIYLQFYIENGLQIANIHSALKMMQRNWLSKYRERNQVMRKQAKSPLEKSFYKTTLNDCFDKTAQNKRNWLNAHFLHFVTNDQKVVKFTNKSTLIF